MNRQANEAKGLLDEHGQHEELMGCVAHLGDCRAGVFSSFAPHWGGQANVSVWMTGDSVDFSFKASADEAEELAVKLLAAAALSRKAKRTFECESMAGGAA